MSHVAFFYFCMTLTAEDTEASNALLFQLGVAMKHSARFPIFSFVNAVG